MINCYEEERYSDFRISGLRGSKCSDSHFISTRYPVIKSDAGVNVIVKYMEMRFPFRIGQLLSRITLIMPGALISPLKNWRMNTGVYKKWECYLSSSVQFLCSSQLALSSYMFDSNSSKNLTMQQLTTNLFKCINQCVHHYY